MTAVDVDALEAAQAAAVVTVETSRQTHVEWAAFLRRNPAYEPGAIGEAEYHEQAVREYENVLAVLANARKYGELRQIIEALAVKYDTPIADGPCAGQRALYGGGDLAYRLRSVLAALDPSGAAEGAGQ